MSGTDQRRRKLSLALKNDRKLNRYSENEKALLYELFERHQEIIDIKLRRNLFSSTRQCEVRECWDLILKTFNEHHLTSERTMKQLQKFWLNAKLRRMFPYDKSKSQSNLRRGNSDSKPNFKKEKQSPINGRLSATDNTDSDCNHHEEAMESNRDSEIDEKSQVHQIKYVVPSNLIIEQQRIQHLQEQTENYHGSSKDICPISNNEHINDFEHDDHMPDRTNEVVEENENTLSISTQEKIDNLRLQEMENRVSESQLRCAAQRLIISKAEEEFQYIQEINKIRLQEAKIRLKILERNCSNGRGNVDLIEGI